jgi:hypothetical protein
MRILFLTDPYMDFLAEEVLCGLRHVLGADVVDHPRKDILYASSRGKVDPSMVWANGCTAFLLEDTGPCAFASTGFGQRGKGRGSSAESTRPDMPPLSLSFARPSTAVHPVLRVPVNAPFGELRQ